MKRTRQMSQRVVLLVGISACLLWSVQGVVEAVVKPDGQAGQTQNLSTQPDQQPFDPSQRLQIPGRGGRLPSREVRQPEYKKGELIVKFKDSVTKCVHCLLQDKKSFAHATTDRSSSLDEFFKKHSIQSARLLYPQWHDKSVQASRAKYQKAIEATKRKFPKRTVRSPKNAATPDLTHTYILEVAEDANIPILCQKLQRDPHVKYAEPNYKVEVQMVPNDPYYHSSGSWGQSYDDLWGIKKIECEKVWGLSQGEGVIVAVVDTGLDYNHPDIVANVWVNAKEIPNNGIDDDNNGFVDDVKGWDFAYNDSDPMDGHGHGTHVSGTIAAVGNNGIGVIGVAPKAKIMAVKGLEDSGGGYTSKLAQCLIYAADNDADVINNSWGGQGSSAVIENAVNYAHGLGCVLIAAAGNDNADVSNFSPANLENVIAVAATDQNDQRCYFSNYGIEIDVSAPGGNGPQDAYNILSLLASNSYFANNYKNYIVGSGYIRLAGTSMAAPHVSGLAALVVSYFPTYSVTQLVDQIKYTADTVLSMNPIGTGRINAFQSLTSLSPKPFISLTAYNIDDSSLGNDNGVVDPGEFFSLTVLLQNQWGEATGVSAKLSSNDPYVQITSPNAEFGDIPTNGQAENLNNPFMVAMNQSAPAYHSVSLLVEINSLEGTKNFSPFSISVGNIPPYQQGWPVQINSDDPPSYSIGSVAIGDVDGDGDNEIAVGTSYLKYPSEWWGWYSPIYLFNHDGTNVRGWPRGSYLGEIGYQPSTTMGDLDGDGDLEIVFSTETSLWAWHHDGTNVRGWPTDQHIQGYGFGPTTIADIDNIPGQEVIVMSFAWNNDAVVPVFHRRNDAVVSVFHQDSTMMAGWPQVLGPDTVNDLGNTNVPAIADVDGDGDKEVIVATNGWPSQGGAKLYIFHHTGELLTSWSIGNYCYSSPVIGDLDQDGINEIIEVSSDGKAYAWHWDGSLLQGWPVSTQNSIDSSPSIGDLDGDGNLEVVLGGTTTEARGAVFAWHYDGTLVSGFPVVLPFTNYVFDSSPAIGDIDGDKDMEIVITSENSLTGKVFVIHHDGAFGSFPVDGVPFGSPALADLDKDGDLEISTSLLRFENLTYGVAVWDISTPYDAGYIEWPQFHHDMQRTGFYTPPNTTTFALQLKVGWNLVSFPGTLVNPDPQALIAGTGIFPPIFRWNANGYDYVKATELKPGEGYWVLTLNEQGETLQVPLTPITQYSIPVMKNHSYMISSVNGQAWQESGGNVAGVFEYDSETSTYLPVNQIEPGQGYWAVATGDGTMRVATDIPPALMSPTVRIKTGGGNPPALIVNDSPEMKAIGTQTVNEGNELSFSVSATDADGDQLSYSASPLPQGASFSNQKFVWTPSFIQAGSYEVTFTISDGELIASETVTITVVNVNQSPTVSLCRVWPRVAKQGQRVYFRGQGTDTDGQVIAYSWRSSIDGQLSTASSFTTRRLSLGEHTIYFKVQDNEGVWSEEVTRRVTIKKLILRKF